ncbi:MAG: Holliday junction resolvase RuvX [Actinomycetota bacterium]|nr:Holliday junction resolvase RuvX [Actinomycetota bacterium]
MTGSRVLALDLGSKWIGLAISNSEGSVAVPRGALRRSGLRTRDHAELARMVNEDGVRRVVVGLPLSMDGTVGAAAQSALDEMAEMSAVLGVPVEPHDERLSTVSASRSAGLGGYGAAEGSRRQRGGAAAGRRAGRRSASRTERDSGQRDSRAAAVVLQSYLDLAGSGGGAG